jgi:hypothetical protein
MRKGGDKMPKALQRGEKCFFADLCVALMWAGYMGKCPVLKRVQVLGARNLFEDQGALDVVGVKKYGAVCVITISMR